MKWNVGVEFKVAALEGIGGEGKVESKRDNVESITSASLIKLKRLIAREMSWRATRG